MTPVRSIEQQNSTMPTTTATIEGLVAIFFSEIFDVSCEMSQMP